MKTTKFFISMLGGLIFSMTACSNAASLDIDNSNNILPSPNPIAGQATIFTTTADGNSRLQQSNATIVKGNNMAPTTIQLNPAETYQTIDGFGFAITYSTCYNLLKMTTEDRMAFLKKIYSTTEGYGVSYARMSIGCNDFSSTEYTLCDKQGLENFQLHTDETQYVLPILKEILSINPQLKVIAAPWTCPKWMKVNNLTDMQPFDSWTDGHINPNYYDTYAQYFVKFIQEMKKQGVNIYAVSPQNEPLNKANCASTYVPWAEQAKLVKALAAQFKNNKLTTKIYVFDHNYNYDNIADQNDYPIKIYTTLGNNFEGAELVVGAAYHDYGGSNNELTDIYNQAPDKELIFSESSIGVWNDGRNLSKRLTEDMKYIALGSVNQHCKAVLVWNLMLDKKMGPNLDGGCQTCYGAVDIDESNYKQISYNSHYYIICHLSTAVKPGAIRIGTSRLPQNNNIIQASFLNPDNTYATIILNNGDEATNITLYDGTNHFSCAIPAKSVVSCRWNK